MAHFLTLDCKNNKVIKDFHNSCFVISLDEKFDSKTPLMDIKAKTLFIAFIIFCFSLIQIINFLI